MSGVTGATGNSGQQGPRGAAGPIGMTGATGVFGAQGTRGPFGPTGLTGGRGPTGNQVDGSGVLSQTLNGSSSAQPTSVAGGYTISIYGTGVPALVNGGESAAISGMIDANSYNRYDYPLTANTSTGRLSVPAGMYFIKAVASTDATGVGLNCIGLWEETAPSTFTLICGGNTSEQPGSSHLQCVYTTAVTRTLVFRYFATNSSTYFTSASGVPIVTANFVRLR
jgi:hypothetical protein